MVENQKVATGDGIVSGQWVPMASWGRRAAARLIDSLVYLIAYLPYFIGLAVLLDASPNLSVLGPDPAAAASVDLGTLVLSALLMLLGSVLGLVAFIWNRCIQQGRTGQSLGKSVLKLYLVSARTGNPIGAGNAFLRELAHVLDGFFYIGYLWPLWDAQKQTFADKVCGTVVAHAVPVAEGPEPEVTIPWSDPLPR